MVSVPEGVTGIGDDCAIIPQESGMETLVSTDMLIEGTHFLMDDITPWQLGWKSAAVNISDIAAMGGSPEGSFLSFALPKSSWKGTPLFRSATVCLFLEVTPHRLQTDSASV